jgi:ribosomal protein L11 methyltransferase
MPLLALRMQVERAQAEALSEALIEGGAQSVSIDEPDHPHPVLSALFGDAESLEACRALLPGAGAAQEVGEQDWVRASESQFEPWRAGRLWIGASWHRVPADAAIALRIDPGLAFGTGSHASTRLVLAFLERELRGGERVLDYGCGSGILAIAAARLGAREVDAVDIDPVAVDVARDNARANAVEVRCSLASALAAGHYQVVVANILARPLIELAPVLRRHVAPRGRIALSGVLEAQAGEVAAAYRPSFDIGRSAGEEGWALITGIKRS